MKGNNRITKLLGSLLGMCLLFAVIPTRVYADPTPQPNCVSFGGDTYYEDYYTEVELKSEGMQPGGVKETVNSYYMDLTNAISITYGYSFGGSRCCDYAGGSGDNYRYIVVDGVKFLKDDTKIVLNPADGWGKNAIVSTVQGYKNFKICSRCGSMNSYSMRIIYIRVEKMLPKVRQQPESVRVDEGGTAVFTVAGDFERGYKWQIYKDGKYVDLTDGSDETGTIYSGTDTGRLTVSNIAAGRDNSLIRCRLLATGKIGTPTVDATLSVNAKTTPTPTPSPTPTIIPTAIPTPIPTVTVTPTPIPTQIVTPTPEPIEIPSSGTGGNTYKPITSSSSYQGIAYPGVVIPSTTNKVGSNENEDNKASEPTKVTVLNDSKINEKPITDDDLLSIADPVSNNKNKATSGKKDNTLSTSNGVGNSMGNMSSTSRQEKNVAKTVMKDGVLYIVDDDTDGQDKIDDSGSSTSKSREEYELENSYSKSDLMADGEVIAFEEEKEKSPFIYVGIILGFLLGLFLLLFFLFFGVIIMGECEEHDDVFEFMGIGFVYRKDGRWCLKVREVFDENAVARLHMGLIFVWIFKDWELVCKCKGIYEGEVKENIEQKMLVYRKKIRRNI